MIPVGNGGDSNRSVVRLQPILQHQRFNLALPWPLIGSDVRPLAINSSGHIFAGTYFGGDVFRSTEDSGSWTPVNNGLVCVETSGLWRSIQPSRFLLEPRAAEGICRSTDNADSWTLPNTGLTSTDIAGLGINNNGHIFAATRSIMGEGGGMFRSTDEGDSWTEQNNDFTAIDANAATFNSAGHVFAAAAGGVFRSTNDGASWTNISSGLIPVGGNVWALAMDSGNCPFAGTAGGGVFRKRPMNYLGAGRSKPEASPYAGAAALRLIHEMAGGLLITASATRAPRWLVRDELSPLRVISTRAVRTTGTRE